MMAAPGAGPSRARPWLARLSFLLAGLAIAILLLYAGFQSITMLAIGLASAAASLAAAFWFLAERGVLRWLSLALLVLSPLAVLAVYAANDVLWVAAASAVAWLLAGLAARSALAPDPADWTMPERPAEPPAGHPFLIMNPRSGGGKVSKFDLQRKAEALGAEVYLLTGSQPIDVAQVAREAVARGADLLGVAGGDGTQALVAGVAAEHGIPFLVITAGTRNHFALDLGLDRADPAACLSALTDGVDLQVDLGRIGGRPFVNNASFGAYAEVVQTPAYREDKLASTLDTLPELLHGERGARLAVQAGGQQIDAAQAVLVANNPYGTGDLAGLRRRARLDRGTLAVVGITVASARQAAGLLRGRRSAGLTTLTAPEVTVTADAAEIPVGIDGEAVTLPVPVRCAIWPGALRVRVPRDRPGVAAPRPRRNWADLWQLARPGGRPLAARTEHAGAEHAGDPASAPADRPGAR